MSDDYLTVLPEDFSELGLTTPLINTLNNLGYSVPTPIQAKIIPHVMSGRDVIGQAQTGTGKTAAFALPLLNQLTSRKSPSPSILVLTPTRELALQVADSFKRYGEKIKQLKVLPIFGGQEYSSQLRALSRGVHIIVGTPGRVMDHIRRGSLSLKGLETIVLDEADEMLKMGFLEDVEWILEQAPEEKQIALFSATMPQSIRRIATEQLQDPVEIKIQQTTVTASTIQQQFLLTHNGAIKRKALDRLLEYEQFDGMLIFVRTKNQTAELCEYITSRGYSAAALNGDIVQSQRIRTVEQLKDGRIDVLIATDVAARGLDVERISHVLNYDVPFDTEAYVHRIGRTGRAGRTGKAILFITPRERSMLKAIERVTRQRIEQMELPSTKEINALRVNRYKEKITATLQEDCSFYANLIKEYCQETDLSPEIVAAALGKLVQGDTPLLLKEERPAPAQLRETRKHGKGQGNFGNKKGRHRHGSAAPEKGMDRYRIDVGETHGVRAGNIVGAIANEANIGSEHIGRIAIFSEYSTVDLPSGLATGILRVLQSTRISGRKLRARKEADSSPSQKRFHKSQAKKRKNGLPGKKRSSRAITSHQSYSG